MFIKVKWSEITCPACSGVNIGQTTRHLATRLKEHGTKSAPVFEHFQACKEELTPDHARILDTVSESKPLLALAAVYNKGQNPSLNTKEEFKTPRLQYAF